MLENHVHHIVLLHLPDSRFILEGMDDVLIVLMGSVLIPIIVFLIYRPHLNGFFKLLFASLLLSLFFDFFGLVGEELIENNMVIYCLYFLLNAILVVLMWMSVPFYSKRTRNSVKYIGVIFVLSSISSFIIYRDSVEAYRIISSLNAFFNLLLGLFYYYQKLISKASISVLKDPYFITASAIILFSISRIIILAGQNLFAEPEMILAWLLRQVYYLIYNVIIAVAFYTLYKIQPLKK